MTGGSPSKTAAGQGKRQPLLSCLPEAGVGAARVTPFVQSQMAETTAVLRAGAPAIRSHVWQEAERSSQRLLPVLIVPGSSAVPKEPWPALPEDGDLPASSSFSLHSPFLSSLPPSISLLLPALLTISSSHLPFCPLASPFLPSAPPLPLYPSFSPPSTPFLLHVPSSLLEL